MAQSIKALLLACFLPGLLPSFTTATSFSSTANAPGFSPGNALPTAPSSESSSTRTPSSSGSSSELLPELLPEASGLLPDAPGALFCWNPALGLDSFNRAMQDSHFRLLFNGPLTKLRGQIATALQNEMIESAEKKSWLDLRRAVEAFDELDSGTPTPTSSSKEQAEQLRFWLFRRLVTVVVKKEGLKKYGEKTRFNSVSAADLTGQLVEAVTGRHLYQIGKALHDKDLWAVVGSGSSPVFHAPSEGGVPDWVPGSTHEVYADAPFFLFTPEGPDVANTQQVRERAKMVSGV